MHTNFRFNTYNTLYINVYLIIWKKKQFGQNSLLSIWHVDRSIDISSACLWKTHRTRIIECSCALFRNSAIWLYCRAEHKGPVGILENILWNPNQVYQNKYYISNKQQPTYDQSNFQLSHHCTFFCNFSAICHLISCLKRDIH